MPDIEILLSDIKDYAVQKAISDLLEEGVDENYIKPMLDKFRNAILTKGALDDLVDELKIYTIGDDKKDGVLDRYVKQVHSDSLTQYIANYTEVLTEDAGLEFYIYLGNLQDDSRPFCKERAGNYYHYKEVELWANEDWAGKIAGTNESNIFTYRGGWNCEHQLVPTLTRLVPKNVVIKAYDKGYYYPTKEDKEFFGLI